MQSVDFSRQWLKNMRRKTPDPNIGLCVFIKLQFYEQYEPEKIRFYMEIFHLSTIWRDLKEILSVYFYVILPDTLKSR